MSTQITSTVVDTPLVRTSPIPNTGRDTIQGNALSPVFFTLVIERLIRWLAAGDRSYKFRTSNQGVGPLAFDDNVMVLARTHEHRTIQARSITAFLDWAGLEAYLDHERRNITAISSLIYKESGQEAPIQIASKEY